MRPRDIFDDASYFDDNLSVPYNDIGRGAPSQRRRSAFDILRQAQQFSRLDEVDDRDDSLPPFRNPDLAPPRSSRRPGHHPLGDLLSGSSSPGFPRRRADQDASLAELFHRSIVQDIEWHEGIGDDDEYRSRRRVPLSYNDGSDLLAIEPCHANFNTYGGASDRRRIRPPHRRPLPRTPYHRQAEDLDPHGGLPVAPLELHSRLQGLGLRDDEEDPLDGRPCRHGRASSSRGGPWRSRHR